MSTVHSNRFNPNEFNQLQPVNPKKPGVQKHIGIIGKILKFIRKAFFLDKIKGYEKALINKNSAIKFINHNRAAIQNALPDEKILEHELTTQTKRSTINRIFSKYLNLNLTKDSVQLSENEVEHPNIDEEPVQNLNSETDHSKPEEALKPSSPSASVKTDPIAWKEIYEDSPQFIVGEISLLPSTIAKHICAEDKQSILLSNDNRQIPYVLWNSGEEYKLFLQNVLLLLEKENTSESLSLQVKVKAKLNAFDKTKTMIASFEKDTGIKFNEYLTSLKNLMRGSWEIDPGTVEVPPEQTTGFNHYLTLIMSLPDDTKSLLFPDYASRNASYKTCIRSASEEFEKQLQRLEILGFIDFKTPVDPIDDERLIAASDWFKDTFSSVHTAKINVLHPQLEGRAETIIITLEQQEIGYDANEVRDHNLMLKELIGKFPEIKEPLEKRLITELTLIKPRRRLAPIVNSPASVSHMLEHKILNPSVSVRTYKIQEKVVALKLFEKKTYQIAACGCVLQCLNDYDDDVLKERRGKILSLLNVSDSTARDKEQLQNFIYEKILDKESIDRVAEYLKQEIQDENSIALLCKKMRIRFCNLNEKNEVLLAQDEKFNSELAKNMVALPARIPLNHPFYNQESKPPHYPAIMENSEGEFYLLIEETTPLIS